MSKLNILYEDKQIIVVEKPCNMLSQADNTKDKDLVTEVKEHIKIKYNKPGNVYLGLVHRLDRPVGGIMVFGKTSKASARLSKQFLEHTISKKYLVICRGLVEKKGKFVDKIERLENGNSIISNKGKEAVLEYKLLEYNKDEDLSLVEVDLKTGRHHQIRVQFASRGHYICGDQRYGKGEEKMQICLFAYYLKFFHPVSGEVMEFKIKPPVISYWTKFTM